MLDQSRERGLGMDRFGTCHSDRHCQSSFFISPNIVPSLAFLGAEELLTWGNFHCFQVILWPQEGALTQRFILISAEPDQLHQTAHSSAKFRVQEHNVESCGSKSSVFQPVKAILQYLPYVN